MICLQKSPLISQGFGVQKMFSVSKLKACNSIHHIFYALNDMERTEDNLNLRTLLEFAG